MLESQVARCVLPQNLICCCACACERFHIGRDCASCPTHFNKHIQLTKRWHVSILFVRTTKKLSDWKLKRTMCMGRAGPTCKSSLTLRKVIESPSQERKGPSWRRSSEGPGHLALRRTVFIEEDAVKPPTQGTDWYAEVAAARTLVTLQQGSGIVHIET